MELSQAIKRIAETGKLELGSKKTVQALRDGNARAVVVAANCPKALIQDIEHYAGLSNTPIVNFSEGAIQLGGVCGKPFPVASLAVINEGVVSLSEFVSGEKKP